MSKNSMEEERSYDIWKPVIVSKVSDIPLLIRENVNGFLCDLQNIESIRDALIKAIESSKENRVQMGGNNREIALNEFDKDSIINKWLSLFN